MTGKKITEGIRVGTIFDSISSELYLIERHADTPDEKEVLMSIPYLQGEHDFSMLLGERVFHSRKITYVFGAFNKGYSERKYLENSIKRVLLSTGYEQLFDTHDRDGFWWGKCSEVVADDDAEYKQIFITITFSCYPYLLSHLSYFDDIWDTFDFEYDVSCFSAYDVVNRHVVPYINNGSTAIRPTLYSSTPMRVRLNDASWIELPGGYVEDYYAKIMRGVNRIEVLGTGKFAILGRKEFMN